MDGPVEVRLHIAEAAVASIAAAEALRVPGVVALRPDLARALIGTAASVLGRNSSASDGVDATVIGGDADVTVTIATRLGYNCRDLAAAVQRAVTFAVAEQTGLATRVTVTVAAVSVD